MHNNSQSNDLEPFDTIMVLIPQCDAWKLVNIYTSPFSAMAVYVRSILNTIHKVYFILSLQAMNNRYKIFTKCEFKSTVMINKDDNNDIKDHAYTSSAK